MNISITAQTLDFLSSVLFGIFLAALYDLLKVLRIRTKYFTAIFDMIFCLLAAAALFMFFMTVGGGEIRIYFLIGIFGGGFFYFMTISSLILKLCWIFTDFIGFIFNLIISPLLFLIKLIKIFLEILRNIFKYLLKWYRIRETDKNMKKTKSKLVNTTEGERRLEKKKSRAVDKNRSGVVGSLRSGNTRVPTETNQ